jgi:phosphoribosylaminoimidazolecarboxamide formyltransferase/IMP cyclohydrolase
VALNTPVEADTAREMAKIFLEIIIAPDFSPRAIEILGAKKNIRLLRLPGCAKPNAKGTLDAKKVIGGLLVQELDTGFSMKAI